MTIKIYKPTSAGRRGMTSVDFSVITKTEPEKNLTKGRAKTSARNNRGRITTRHQGGGHKKLYRFIDFKQNKSDIPARVMAIEYDPNRTAFIALIVYKDGEKRYILAPRDLKINDEIVTSENAPLEIGNRLMLKNIPVGTLVYNVELEPGRGGTMIRSAGSSARVLAHEGKYTNIEMASTEVRKILTNCFASIGLAAGNL